MLLGRELLQGGECVLWVPMPVRQLTSKAEEKEEKEEEEGASEEK